ncbi:MAG: hydantoinase/oxoprolinase family protein [Actinobacteria bacterium]|nr:hydantoinase/oxoprolinase family protein [Actinomycetota bacterium]
MTVIKTDKHYKAAVDVGGTFTDLLIAGEEGITALKVPSTPATPEKSVIKALSESGGLGLPLVHGSTVATNAILEKKGVKTAFVTTEGFKDVIEIGRQNRPSLYALPVEKPDPLIPSSMRLEAGERIVPGGGAIRKLTRKDARLIAEQLKKKKVKSAAVCLLFSFENPEHELMLLEELEKLGIDVSISSRVLPEYREYERASTTVLNAYISPVMRSYLERLEEVIQSGVTTANLRLMHSAGGTVSSETARTRPVDLVLSGPAGGVIASEWLGNSLGIDQLITFDMGGTSTDVSLIDNEVTITRETKINGLPLALPMIDIHTIGAGGGSIAYVDKAGVLKVGPKSAGADPGPACYGRGTRPTVTDANLVLGRLIPDKFLGGRMKLDTGRSIDAFGKLPGNEPIEASAIATLEIALSNMETAIKKVSLERGYDPRDFTMVAFGGAGPMHACELAEKLEIPRVMVPVFPGLFSSMGMLLAHPGRDYSRSVIRPLDIKSTQALRKLFTSLEKQAADDMKREGFPRSRLKFIRRIEARYKGQSHGVTFTVVKLDKADISRRFVRAYESAYGKLQPGFEIEIVNAQLTCRAPVSDIKISAPERSENKKPRAIKKHKMYFGRMVEGRVYIRCDLSPAHPISGPAVIVQDDTTTMVPPGWRGTIDIMGNLDLLSPFSVGLSGPRSQSTTSSLCASLGHTPQHGELP